MKTFTSTNVRLVLTLSTPEFTKVADGAPLEAFSVARDEYLSVLSHNREAELDFKIEWVN